MKIILLALGQLAFAAIACMPVPAEAGSVEFRSHEGFAVRYPTHWREVGSDNRLGTSRTRLNIVSSVPGVQGMVIGQGQAEIIVERESPERTAWFEEIEQLRLDPAQVLSSRNVPPEARGPGPCQALTEIASREVIGPGVAEMDRYLICRINGVRFLTTLRYFDGDERASEYSRIAQDVTNSIEILRR